MHILVINPGSSSIKFSAYATQEGAIRSLYEGEVSGIGGDAKLEFRAAAGDDLAGRVGVVKAGTMEEAIGLVERAVGLDGLPRAEAVGYRVVHPGAKLKGHQRVTAEVLAQLKEAVAFAPLHDPAAIEIIEQMMRRLPEVPHVACFDTVFHETMAEEAYVYPLPEEVRAQGVRRYGFHGLSCESVVVELQEALGDAAPKRVVIAHLGSGCSVTACIDGRSAETTMGLTPTGGVMMGTRPGDLDPGVVLYLLRRDGATVDSVEAMLNHEAGLKALGGTSDMRALRAKAGDGAAELAVRVFCRTVVKAIAAYVALHGADAVVFTGGIGEHDAASRREIAGGLAGLGVAMDEEANGAADGTGMRSIGTAGARIGLYVVPAEEDRMIARHVTELCATSHQGDKTAV